MSYVRGTANIGQIPIITPDQAQRFQEEYDSRNYIKSEENSFHTFMRDSRDHREAQIESGTFVNPEVLFYHYLVEPMANDLWIVLDPIVPLGQGSDPTNVETDLYGNSVSATDRQAAVVGVLSEVASAGAGKLMRPARAVRNARRSSASAKTSNAKKTQNTRTNSGTSIRPQECFVAGTAVLLSYCGDICAIETVAVGDTVLTYNETTHLIEPGVVVSLSTNYTNELYFVVVGQDTIVSTSEHPFYTSQGWIAAGQLETGDSVKTTNGYVVVLGNTRVDTTNVPVYNFEVVNNHTYFVSEQGVLVHNDCPDLADLVKARRDHILNRHRPGAGKPGKTEFPADWSDDKIIESVIQVAKDPNSIRTKNFRDVDVIRGRVDGVDIEVQFYPSDHVKAGQISSAYPTNTPRNP